MQNKILLHACCGICSGYPIELLRNMGYSPVVFFYNPNLDTKDEYDRRLDAQKIVCNYHSAELIAEDYNHDKFLNRIGGLELEPERGLRCNECIKLRLEITAQKASDLSIAYFTTSLVISPHKNFKIISDIGSECAKQHPNLEYVPIDFKKKDGFLKTNKLSKELGLYRQNYCGCEFSKH